MDGIRYWIESEGTGHCFFLAFPVILLCLFIWFKGRRVRFLIPSLLISIVIINPLFYKKWDELGLYAYWRVLWIVPVIPIVAGLVPSITERIGKAWVKAVVVAAGVGLTVFGGTFLYHGERGSFVEAANVSKLPDYAVQIADRLLELDDHPRAVFQSPIGTYVRQYTGEIDQLYGRDIDGYIFKASNDARNVHNQINNGDMEAVATFMANDSYEYLVVDPSDREALLFDAGFELIDYVGGYGIYRGHGKPTQIRERNELGQLLSISAIDEEGQLINGETGYATVTYEYDQNGYITREFHIDANGLGVADSNGRAGYEREYDNNAHVLMERYIDPDGKAINNSLGYAEYRRTYHGSDIITESYFNSLYQPVNRIDTNYASAIFLYDGQHHRISERYFDMDGNPVASNLGYAHVARRYDDKNLIAESYYDINDRPITIVKGYHSFSRTYDKNGNVLTELYLDTEGKAVNCINGYAKILYEYDSDSNITRQVFRDETDMPVITPYGYAEVRRIYNGRHLIREEYYGVDGASLMQPAGYYAIAQEWDGDILTSRSYLDSKGNPAMRTDGYAKVIWKQDKNCSNVHCYKSDGQEVEIGDLNLVKDVKFGSDGWSDWMIPNPNTVNYCFNIGFVNLGPKTEGDMFTSTVEIEYRNVSATPGQQLRFWAQGAQDGQWITGNVWNGNLVYLYETPSDGIYRYQSTVAVSGDMADISTFNVGFRCDYWASGMFRVHKVKIEKGDTGTDWSPGI